MPRKPERRKQSDRPSSYQRGYDWTWRTITRPYILRRDPICKLCPVYRPHAAPKASDTVDHIVPKSKGGSDREDNLRGACRECNSRRRDDMGGEGVF